jgi:hypothetical protein
LAGLAAGLFGAGLLWFGRQRARPAPAPPTVVTTQCVEPQAHDTFGEPVAPATPPPMLLGDGSMAALHGAMSTLFSEELSSERVRLRLSGGATFAVVPNEARSFVVSNGQVVVRALGTTFSVDPEGARTRVAVEHGRVQILWPRGAATLSAGQAAIFPPEDEAAFAPAMSIAPARHKLRVKHAGHAHKRARSRAKKVRSAAR